MLYLFVNHQVFWDLALEWQHLLEEHFPKQIKIIAKIPDQMSRHLVIMFGLNTYKGQMPKNYIAVQLEQTPQSGWFTDDYLQALKGALAVWDYSITNFKDLRKYNTNYHCITLGYGSTWIDPDLKQEYLNKEKQYDVLFLGQLNQRRKQVIDQLQQQGLRCYVPDNCWGEERLKAILSSRVVLNIHYYQKAILEAVRLAPLLSVGACIISETSCDPVLDHQYGQYCKLTSYEQLVEQTVKIVRDEDQLTSLKECATKFVTTRTRLPLDCLKEKHALSLIEAKDNESVEEIDLDRDLEDLITSSNDIQEVDQDTSEGVLKVRLNQFEEDELPPVSIITVTRNRKRHFQMPIRNFNLFDYPSEKLEWIIIDDSDKPDQDLTDILPDDDRIRYIHLLEKHLLEKGVDQKHLLEKGVDQKRQNLSKSQKKRQRKKDKAKEDKAKEDKAKEDKAKEGAMGEPGSRSALFPHDIGYKRNLGVREAKYDYIVMMDDDDYYYPLSVYSRIAILLSYPQYGCVGVADLDVYDLKAQSCARFQSPYLAEASLAFTREFWLERPFPEEEHALGEGYPFTQKRRNRLIKMPSCFNLIAITHGQNLTGKRRQVKVLERLDLFKQLDLQTKLFLFDWEESWN